MGDKVSSCSEVLIGILSESCDLSNELSSASDIRIDNIYLSAFCSEEKITFAAKGGRTRRQPTSGIYRPPSFATFRSQDPLSVKWQ